MGSEASYNGLLDELKEAFNEAESAIHEAESVTQRTPVAALNELRYAGSHMLVSLLENKLDELQQAVMHARRAFYDAQRFELLFLMRDAQAIRDGIGDQIPMYVDLVAKACGGATYARLKTQLIEAKAYIQRMAQIKSDSKRWERRNEAFAECAPHIEALQKYIELYETLSDEFIRARKEKEEASLKEERKERRNFILGVIGVIAAFISIVIGIVALVL